MKTKIFKNNDELKKLIKKSINDDEYIDFEGYNVICEFDIDLKGVSLINTGNINAKHISALNISALHINARNISALNISASNIKANYINYYAVCFVYGNITCKSIEGERENSKHFCVDGEITINK